MTPAELERLVKLNEECAEVQQIISKIILHGYETSCPVPHELGQDTNRNTLIKEVSDILFWVGFLINRGDFGDIDEAEVHQKMDKCIREKANKVNKYLHYNSVTPEELKEFNDYN